MTRLPLALLSAYGIRPTTERPTATRGFAGRAAMLELWDRMDADQQDQALLAMEAILGRNEEPVVVPAVMTGKR